MPIDLVLVRHGQSEGNVAVAASKRGDRQYIESEEFRLRHSGWWRLTELGVQQAQQAGEWVRENIGGSYDRYYTSSYTRAMETAAYLGLPDARWYIDPRLRERQRGHEDLWNRMDAEELAKSVEQRDSAPLYWRPLNGESIADVCFGRVRDVIETLHRETSEGKAIIVCHGEVMESFRVVLERLTQQQYQEWTRSPDPHEHIYNGQVFHFTRRSPEDGEITRHLNWWRSISPTDLSLCNPAWRPIQRPSFGNEELLALAEETPRLIR